MDLIVLLQGPYQYAAAIRCRELNGNEGPLALTTGLLENRRVAVLLHMSSPAGAQAVQEP